LTFEGDRERFLNRCHRCARSDRVRSHGIRTTLFQAGPLLMSAPLFQLL
jgi:hypothetical protein